MWIPLLELGVADVETIGCGKFQGSLTFHVMGTKAATTMGITEHTGGSADVTDPVTNCIGLDCICLTTTHVLQDILAVLHE